MISFIIDEKGEEVISDRHQSDYKKEETEDQLLTLKPKKIQRI